MPTNLVVPTPVQPSPADIIGAMGGLPGYGLGFSPQAMQQVNNAVRSGPVAPFGPTPQTAKLLKPQNVSIVGPGDNTVGPLPPIYKYVDAQGVTNYTDVAPASPTRAPPVPPLPPAPPAPPSKLTPFPIGDAPNNGQGVGKSPHIAAGLMQGLSAAGQGLESDYYGAKQALGQTLGLGIDTNAAREAAQQHQTQADAINSEIHNESGVGSYLGRGAQILGSLAPNAAAFVGAQFIPGLDLGVDASALARVVPFLVRLGIAGLAGAGQGVSEQDVAHPKVPLTGGDLAEGLAGGALQSAANEALPGLGGKALEGGLAKAFADGGVRGLLRAGAGMALTGAREGAIAGGLGSVGANLARNQNLLNNLLPSAVAGAAFGGAVAPVARGLFGRTPAGEPGKLPSPPAQDAAAPLTGTIDDLLAGKGVPTQDAAAFGMNDNAPAGDIVPVNGTPQLIRGRPTPLAAEDFLKQTAPYSGGVSVTGSNDLALFKQLQAQTDAQAQARASTPYGGGVQVTESNDLASGVPPLERAPGVAGTEVNEFPNTPEGQIRAYLAANGAKDLTDEENSVLPALGKSKTLKSALTKLNSGANKGDGAFDRLRGALQQMQESTPASGSDQLPKF